MPRSYPSEFRRRVLDLVKAGKPVAQAAFEVGVSAQTVYNWRAQELVDTGERPGLSSMDSSELTAARRRIRGLETELGIARRASGGAFPKGDTRRSR